MQRHPFVKLQAFGWKFYKKYSGQLEIAPKKSLTNCEAFIYIIEIILVD
jgi:hypothetical protein